MRSNFRDVIGDAMFECFVRKCNGDVEERKDRGFRMADNI